MLGNSKLRTSSKILSWLILALCVTTVNPYSFAAESRSADQIVDSLQKNYDATVDFVADFRQETEVKTLNRNLKAWGKLSFKRKKRCFGATRNRKGNSFLQT